MDLSDVIDKSQLHCLNEERAHPVANLLTASDTYLESDTDEQLIIEIRFTQAVKLHSIKIRATSLRTRVGAMAVSRRPCS